MREDLLYSVRMRAADAEGRHVSGAERIVSRDHVEKAGAELLRRALDRCPSAAVTITCEAKPVADVERIPALCLRNAAAIDPRSARLEAEALLQSLGVSLKAVEAAFSGLTDGMGSDGAQLRGAALMDAESGARLDPDTLRGVRARHFDYAGREAAKACLRSMRLGHFRTLEALCLASKVVWSGVLAEVCWSDEPDYVAGYVASASTGYVRFSHFKPAHAAGGRVFFIAPDADVPEIIRRLEQHWTLVDS